MTDRPTAAPATWPYAGHRDMAEVLRDEAIEILLRAGYDDDSELVRWLRDLACSEPAS